MKDNFRLLTEAEKHKRHFNTPIINVIAVVISGNEFNLRDKVLQKKDNRLQRVFETNRAYDVLLYQLNWKGKDGYKFDVMQVYPTTRIH